MKLDHDECNYHPSNTRDVFGPDEDLDLPLCECTALPPTGWIRLLKFRVSRTGDGPSIRCTLSHRTFEEAEGLHYDALSYAWGDPYRTHHFVCDGGRVPITANLADWFQHREDGSYVFWIDAISINQVDKIERSYQVNQMRRVYRTANFVVAWLGGVAALNDISNPFPHHTTVASDDGNHELEALHAMSELQQELMTVWTDAWLVSNFDQAIKLGVFERLAVIWACLRFQVERFRGFKLMIHHSKSSPSNARFPEDRNWSSWQWHYTARRHTRSAKQSPLITLFKRPYFSRRWISDLRSYLTSRRFLLLLYNFVSITAFQMTFRKQRTSTKP